MFASRQRQGEVPLTGRLRDVSDREKRRLARHSKKSLKKKKRKTKLLHLIIQRKETTTENSWCRQNVTAQSGASYH